MDKEKKKQPMEPVDLEEEELETGVEDISVDEASQFRGYLHICHRESRLLR
jgi:hypothetical protein